MDRIEFLSRPSGHAKEQGEIRIHINGVDLIDLVKRVEHAFAGSLSGKYAGLRSDKDTHLPSRHFFGEPSYAIYGYAGKTQVLGCECGEPGCWPLVCRIEADSSRVRWSDFEQPFRSGARGSSRWSYEALGPFEFDRKQYDEALKGVLDARGRRGRLKRGRD
jgi:hypothetical protein